MLNQQVKLHGDRQIYLTLNILSLALTCGLIFGCLGFASPARALLRQHHEAPQILRYHAQDSLKDRDGNTWQVILFPQDNDNFQTEYYLRLVGFPGVNAFTHPQSLELLTSQGQIFTALDSYGEVAPADNVGQYNLTPIIDRLPSKGTLKLAIPLANHRELALKIPSETLTEWQLLTEESLHRTSTMK